MVTTRTPSRIEPPDLLSSSGASGSAEAEFNCIYQKKGGKKCLFLEGKIVKLQCESSRQKKHTELNIMLTGKMKTYKLFLNKWNTKTAVFTFKVLMKRPVKFLYCYNIQRENIILRK